MDILSKIIKLFFGTKADNDYKEIAPYVEKIGRASCRERV